MILNEFKLEFGEFVNTLLNTFLGKYFLNDLFRKSALSQFVKEIFVGKSHSFPCFLFCLPEDRNHKIIFILKRRRKLES